MLVFAGAVSGSAAGTPWRVAGGNASLRLAECQDAARHASFEVSLKSSAMAVRSIQLAYSGRVQ
ncbi:MAG: hypothetical protein ACXWX1_12190, partial [Aeromicrobium sp.]